LRKIWRKRLLASSALSVNRILSGRRTQAGSAGGARPQSELREIAAGDETSKDSRSLRADGKVYAREERVKAKSIKKAGVTTE
jgi:hypothetical protein